jgi:hypothetical protein
MTPTLASMALALALATPGGLFFHRDGAGPGHHHGGGKVLPPGPGYGWGFPNGNPDGEGYVDFLDYLPLGADRIAGYYFPRYMGVPPQQLLLPTYYNPYLTRGQRYLPYVNCGGAHPAGGPPPGSAVMPMHPYNDSLGTGPTVRVPTFTGNVAADPTNAGSTGLTP